MSQTWLRITGLCALVLCLDCGYATKSEQTSRAEVGAAESALIAPDGDLHDFPPWIWPYIRTATIFTRVLEGKLVLKEAQVALSEAVEDCGCALAASKADLPTVLAALDTGFGAQYSAARLAQLGSVHSPGIAADGDVPLCPDWWPFPKWPPVRSDVLGLLELQGKLFERTLTKELQLDAKSQQVVHDELVRHITRISGVFK